MLINIKQARKYIGYYFAIAEYRIVNYVSEIVSLCHNNYVTIYDTRDAVNKEYTADEKIKEHYKDIYKSSRV